MGFVVVVPMTPDASVEAVVVVLSAALQRHSGEALIAAMRRPLPALEAAPTTVTAAAVALPS